MGLTDGIEPRNGEPLIPGIRTWSDFGWEVVGWIGGAVALVLVLAAVVLFFAYWKLILGTILWAAIAATAFAAVVAIWKAALR